MAESKQPSAVSPFSTGGGGGNFEIKVAVTYIAKMLTGKIGRACDGGAVRAVKLQQRNRRRPVDDVIVVFEKNPDEGELSLQAKHSLRFTTGDDDFSDALQQCWRQFRREDFDDARHRVGIAFGEGSNIEKVRKHLPEFLEWARTSESATAFLEKVLAIKAKAKYLDTFRQVLAKAANHPISDAELWRFLKVFVAVPFDFTGSASRDRTDVIETLREVVPNGSVEGATDLADKLFSIASDFAKSGGEITFDNLLPQIPAAVGSRIPSAAIENARSTEHRLADQVHRQLTKQVNSHKYIPKLFVEANKVKDIARQLCNPVRFFGASVAGLQRLNLTRVNTMCRDFGLPELSVDLPEGFAIPTDIQDVADACVTMRQLCRELGNRLKEHERTPAGENLTEQRRYLLAHKWHTTGASSVGFSLTDVQRQFDYLEGGVLLLLSPAGQGKTNFICNLAQLTLLYGIPAVFFTGKSLENAPLANLEDFIWSMVDPGSASAEEKIERVRRLCLGKNMPFVVLIDAINEHNHLSAFACALESCIEHLMALDFVQVVLTCRSEFFDARFSNLETSSFSKHLHKIDRLHGRMEPVQTARMVRRYFDFYKLRPALSEQAKQKLKGDPFLLRIFCEVYGDPKSADMLRVPFMANIYKDRLLADYLAKKLQQMVQRRADGGAPVLGGHRHYLEPLMVLAGEMIESEDFSSVHIDIVPTKHLEAVEELLYEDIIISRCLSFARKPIIGDEVLAFPFDELRDFVIAKYLVDVELRRDEQTFLDKTRNLLQARCPITEGVSRFLFCAAKRSGHDLLHELVKDEQWFKDSFLEAIFEVEDDLVDEHDLAEIRRRFLEDPARITIDLIHRYDYSTCKRLNIGLLFTVLDELSNQQFETFIVPIFESSLARLPAWPIERLSETIADAVLRSDPDNVERLSPLIELLFYLLPIQGAEYQHPARDALTRVLEAKPEVANHVFVTKLKSLSRVHSPHHWDFVVDRVRGGHELPEGVCDTAVDLWNSLSDEDEHTRTRLEQFFINARGRKACELPEAIVEKIEERYQERTRQWSRLL